MAANAVIGSLRVNLGMDSAEFQNGAKRAQSTLSGLGTSIKAFAAGAVAALSFGTVTAALKSSIDHMDELGKAAQKIGIPVEQLSGLEYAARLADVSLGDLQSNLSKFNRALGEIAGGGKNDAGAALKAIGVSALDANGKLRPTSDLIADIADKFASYKDGAEKAALAQAIFGKSGADMIPLLNGGRDAIKEATDEAARFGLIVNEDAAKAAEQFNDNLTRLQGAGQGLVQIIAGPLVQGLADLTDKMMGYINVGSNAESITTAIKNIFVGLMEIVRETAAEFEKLSLIYGYVVDFFTKGTKASLDPAGAWDDLQKKIAGVNEELDRANRFGRQFTNTVGKGDRLGGGTGPAGGNAPVLPTLTKPSKAAAKKPVDEVKETTVSLYDMDLAFAKVAATAQDASNAFGDAIQESFGSWIDQAIDGTFRLQDSLKGLLSSLTKLALNNVMQGLFSGGGGHALYGGGGIGGIFSKLFGFAKGGTILPGGHGGIDSQLVAFRKSPNERVDITKPGQTLHSGGSGVQIIDQRTNAPAIDQVETDGVLQLIIRDAVRQEAPGAVRREMRNYNISKPTTRR